MKAIRIKEYSTQTFYKQYEVSKIATMDGRADFVVWSKEMVVPINTIGNIEQVIFETTETTSITRREIPVDIVYDVVDYDDICKLMVLKTEI
jgi:hypothetical protein